MGASWGLVLCFADAMLAVVGAWLVVCISFADEIARGIRQSEIGPFHVG